MTRLIKSAFAQRATIWRLAKYDIKSRYLGSALGSFWVFVLPLINLSIMWFAFEFGLKAKEQNGMPFILWLVSGMVPWTFFSEAVSASTGSIIEKSYLVKKVVFNVELLPIVKVAASATLFLFLMIVMVAIFSVYGIYPNIYWVQVPYYMTCLFFLIFGISWFTSSIVVFYRDLGQVISVLLQVGFWLTPIFWSPKILPKQFSFITFLNPMNYIITGFRDSFMFDNWFWENPMSTVYFWSVVTFFWIVGSCLFRKLRPHFADVL